MKVNMQPPPEDPFCGGARRAETPRPVDIKRDGGGFTPTLPHNFHLPPPSSRSLLLSTGASWVSHPFDSGASASRARARRFSGARCNLWVPAANRCRCRWRDERNHGRTRRDAGGNDASTPVRSFGMLFRTIGITRRRPRASNARVRAGFRNQRRVEMAACRPLSTTTDEIRVRGGARTRGRRLPAPLRISLAPSSARLSHPKKLRVSATALRLHLARFARTPPVLLFSEKRPAVIRGPHCVPFLCPRERARLTS